MPDRSVTPRQPTSRSLKPYYFLRFVVAAAWAALAFAVAGRAPALAAIMLVGYPAWDAIANLADALRSGGLARNRSQTLNMVVSLATAIAVAIALARSMNAVLFVYAVWAALAGLFQLVTAVRRWKTTGAQWAMILSGAQSMLAGGHMASRAAGAVPHAITDIAPYAAFGAFYFLVSAVWLSVADLRTRSRHAAA